MGKNKKLVFRDLEAKSVPELAQLEADLAGKRFSLRMQHAVGQVENTAEIRATRRDLARVKTALGNKTRTAANAGSGAGRDKGAGD
jgi:large subunit ribosomal protein L29